MRIIFIFYFNYNLNIHRRRSRPDSVGKLKGQPDNRDNHPPPPPAGFHAPIEVTTCTYMYVVFTNDLQIVYYNKITGLKIIIIISFITCLFYTDLCLFVKV